MLLCYNLLMSIMQKIQSGIKSIQKYILPSICLLTVFIVFLLSFFNSPIADDWGFYTTTFRKGFFSYLHLTYVAHTARFGQWGLIWIGFRLFGMTFTRIYPFISFVALVSILALIFIRSGLIKKTKKAIAFSILASAAYLCTCPSFLDSFLWLDSNLAHFTSIVFSLLILLEIITLSKVTKRKNFIVRLVFLLAICFIAQFFSELTDILNIAFVSLFCLIFFVKRKQGSHFYTLLKICLPCIASLIVGFLILYYSPARIARSSYSNSSFSILTIKESAKTFSSFFLHVPFIAYALILLAGFSFSKHIKDTFLNIRGILLCAVVLIATTICSFLVICYAQGFAVPRTLTVTAFGFSLTMIYIVAFVTKLLSKKAPKFQIIGFYLSIVLVLILGAITIPPYIEKIATRHLLAEQRDINVKNQIENGTEIVEVSELPILVYGTAEDFYYYDDPESGERLPIWVAEQYIDYIRGDHEKPNYILKQIDDYSKNYRR